MAASGGTYGIKCDPDVSYPPDCYAQNYQYDQKLLQEPLSEMDLAGFLEMDDKMLSGKPIQYHTCTLLQELYFVIAYTQRNVL